MNCEEKDMIKLIYSQSDKSSIWKDVFLPCLLLNRRNWFSALHPRTTEEDLSDAGFGVFFFTPGNILCCLEAPNHCCADLCVKKVVLSFFFSLMVTEIAICGFTAVCCG